MFLLMLLLLAPGNTEYKELRQKELLQRGFTGRFENPGRTHFPRQLLPEKFSPLDFVRS